MACDVEDVRASLGEDNRILGNCLSPDRRFLLFSILNEDAHFQRFIIDRERGTWMILAAAVSLPHVAGLPIPLDFEDIKAHRQKTFWAGTLKDSKRRDLRWILYECKNCQHGERDEMPGWLLDAWSEVEISAIVQRKDKRADFHSAWLRCKS